MTIAIFKAILFRTSFNDSKSNGYDVGWNKLQLCYGSLFTTLYYIWTNDPHKWNKMFTELNPTAAPFVKSYQRVYNESNLGEYAQDIAQTKLHHDAPQKFPSSHSGTALAEVIHVLVESNHSARIWTKYSSCDVSTVSADHIDIHIIEVPH